MLQAGPLTRQKYGLLPWFIGDEGETSSQVSTELQLQSSSAHQSLSLLSDFLSKAFLCPHSTKQQIEVICLQCVSLLKSEAA